MSASNEKKLLIFLSHASQDKSTVREICERLKADGFDPWLDEERLLPGMNWDMEIEKALRASDSILLCFSSLSVEKEGYVQREYKRAMRYQEEKPEGTIYVIPVRLDSCELPYFIKDVQFVDYPGGYDRLVVSLNLRSGKITSASPIPAKKEFEKAASTPGSSSGGPNGQVTNVSGGINIQGRNVNIEGDIVTGNKNVYGSSAPNKENLIKGKFEIIVQQINELADDPDVDKSYILLFVKDIEKEVIKDSDFNEKKLKTSLKMLMKTSQEIYSSVVNLLKSPEMNTPHEIQNLID